jgi:hypothetical protein
VEDTAEPERPRITKPDLLPRKATSCHRDCNDEVSIAVEGGGDDPITGKRR